MLGLVGHPTRSEEIPPIRCSGHVPVADLGTHLAQGTGCFDRTAAADRTAPGAVTLGVVGHPTQCSGDIPAADLGTQDTGWFDTAAVADHTAPGAAGKMSSTG
jgi:hypothetical protein